MKLTPRAPGDLWNLLFVAPFLIAYVALLVVPLFFGVWMSFQSYDMFDGIAQYAGFDNYARLFNDGIFLGTVRNTLLFVLITVPVFVALGLGLAVMLNGASRLQAVMRATFFGTTVLSVTVVTIVWRVFFLPNGGLLSEILSWVGLEPIVFLTSPALSLVAVAVATVWWGLGLPMILFVAALQQVPDDLYEAAELDSAGPFRTFFFITLPSIRRTLAVVVVYETILQFQLFGQSQLMTQGGPNNTSRSIVLFIYEQGFRNWDLGYAAAASEVLFLLIAAVAMLQFWLTNRRAAS